MAITSNRLGETLTRKVRSTLGIRFGRFAVAAMAAFATSEIVYVICAGPLGLSSTEATLIGWFSGVVVSYVLSRWAWERKGRPNLLRETVPFCVVSAIVIVVLELADKYLGYHPATWWHLTGAERALYLAAGVRRGEPVHVRCCGSCSSTTSSSPGRWPGPGPPPLKRRSRRPTPDPTSSPPAPRTPATPRTPTGPRTASADARATRCRR